MELQEEIIKWNLTRLNCLKEVFNTSSRINSMKIIYQDNPLLLPVWLTCCFELGIIERTGKHRNYNYTLSNKEINYNLAKEVKELYYKKQKLVRDEQRRKAEVKN